MTEKRFTITQDFEEHHRQIRDNGHIIMGCFIEPQAEVIVDFLNHLNDENEQLKQSYKEFEDECQSTFNAMSRKQNDLYRKNFKLKEENEELKHQNEGLSDELEQLRNKNERYKRLSEIRQQEINNRILTIKDFINNCSDNKVRSVLKELFYSEVNEYDLSLENRKLLNENEKLKQLLLQFYTEDEINAELI